MDDPQDPEWLPGGQAYKIREISMFTLYGLYTIFVFTTTAMFLLQSRNVHSELSKRSVILVTLQAIGAFVVGTVGLVSSAILNWTCFFKLWILSIGLILLMTTICARAIQLIVVSKIHNLNKQLVRNNPQFMDNIKGKLLRKFSFTQKNQKGARQASGSGFIDKQLLSEAINESKSLMDAAKKDKILKDLDWYFKVQPYATNRSMTIYIACAMALTCIMTIVVTVTNSNFALKPMKTVCNFFWGFIPLYAIGSLFLVVICPALLFMTWGLRDAYGIRRDLIVCVTVGLGGHILMLIWEARFKQWNDRWSNLFFLWFSVMLIHIFSVVIPLWRSITHMRKLNHHLRSESPASMSTVTLIKGQQPEDSVTKARLDEGKGIRQNQYGKFRQAFIHVLEDDELYDKFKDFASSCFCSELISFVDEYQTLKVLTLVALGQREYSTDPGLGSATSPLIQSPMSGMFAISDSNSSHGRDSYTSLPPNINLSKIQNNATVSILEAAKEIYPDRGFNHATMFPPALMDALVMIFSNYINSTSPTAVNVPQIMIRRIQEKLNQSQLHLTILDEVKDEVLYLLYVNVFTRFTS
ncbi:hypothetical protein GGI12_003867 [Dipsacomyces acuminosporus]|nr:hypothetical protein GGI12_003867 [Dipsacomyces acuminosporus]